MEHQKTTKGFNGLGLAGTLAGSLALLGQASNGGGVLGNVFGNGQPAAVTAAETALVVPLIAQAYASGGGYGRGCDPCDKPVTKEVLALTSTNAAKDAEIAQLKAEKYTDAAIKDYDRTEVEPLKTRVCALETAEAVNAARDKDFRRYVEREFVHQPKASIRESIVVCRQCGCEHDRDCECECGHGRR